ncbi:MAG: hypothetical protein KGH57_02820 [Candidatus Micrarchaeota archaeon]|nr:hypothetical protein [Candidatus Micrarchaeota archaeon]
MATKGFHFRVPWTTIYIAILVPLLTYLYGTLPQAWKTPLMLWITSPFNITYDSSGLLLNYVLLVFIYLMVDIYTRNIAHLKHRVSLIRNAGLISVFSSYIVSALVWHYTGYPSSGTSILAFNVLIFSAFETYDAELIKRMSERGESFRKRLEIVSISFIFLVLILSAILFIYLNGNTFWYVHILGGVIFAPIYYIYLNRWVRPRIDRFEEVIEKDVEKDLEKTGEEIEEGTEKIEKDVIKRPGKKKKTGA